jgi:hypothetical protein
MFIFDNYLDNTHLWIIKWPNRFSLWIKAYVSWLFHWFITNYFMINGHIEMNYFLNGHMFWIMALYYQMVDVCVYNHIIYVRRRYKNETYTYINNPPFNSNFFFPECISCVYHIQVVLSPQVCTILGKDLLNPEGFAQIYSG